MLLLPIPAVPDVKVNSKPFDAPKPIDDKGIYALIRSPLTSYVKWQPLTFPSFNRTGICILQQQQQAPVPVLGTIAAEEC